MSSEFSYASAEKTAGVISGKIGGRSPVVGIILGSGLGGLSEKIEDSVRIPYGDIPGFPVPKALGHAGTLICGTLAGKQVVAMAGRFHIYEGHGTALAGFPVRVMHALGVRTLFVSNAAGGVNEKYAAGDLMIIEDHLNLMWTNPLIGPQQPGEERFTDMSDAYDGTLRQLLRDAAGKNGTEMREGVYAALFGPSYETRAEVRMLRGLGADAVGMSTVPEVLVARALGIRVAGISAITNAASGVTAAPVSHAEVLDVGRQIAAKFEALVTEFVRLLD
ncbi:MAG: purine-nucleoside phosphorylase [Gemmatimonadaceae bacterium]|nr:purine-nucleoside phosphorylase [Gemmatimonadaceae bacterium]